MGHVAGPVIWSFLWQFIYFIFACPMYDPLMMRQAAVRWMPPLVLPIGVAKPSTPGQNTILRVQNSRVFSRASPYKRWLPASAGLGASQSAEKYTVNAKILGRSQRIFLEKHQHTHPGDRGHSATAVCARGTYAAASTAKNTVLAPARHRVVQPPHRPPRHQLFRRRPPRAHLGSPPCLFGR